MIYAKLAQILNVEEHFQPTKVSLFLKPSLLDSGNYFDLSTNPCFSALNFKYLNQGTSKLWVTDEDLGYEGKGYIEVLSDTLDPYPSLVYPIRATSAGSYYVWIRGQSKNGSYKIAFYLDDVFQGYIEDNDSANCIWIWRSFELDIEDSETHELKIVLQREGMTLDKIVINSSSAYVPCNVGPNFTDSPYLTAICQIYTVNNDLPYLPLKTLDYYSTLDELKNDGWYSFDISFIDYSYNTTISNKYCIVLTVAGSSNRNYLLWEDGSSEIEVDTPSALFSPESFTPNVISDIYFWFNGSSVQGVEDGNNITTLVDLSNNNRDAYQNTDANKPSFHENQVNSLPAIKIESASQEFLNLSNSFNESAFTLFLYSKQISTRLIALGGSSEFFGTSINDFFLLRDDADAGITNTISGTDGDIEDWKVYVAKLDAQNFYFYLDNKLRDTSVGPHSNVVFDYIGKRTIGQFSDGYIAELICYNRSLTNCEMQRVLNYIYNKYSRCVSSSSSKSSSSSRSSSSSSSSSRSSSSSSRSSSSSSVSSSRSSSSRSSSSSSSKSSSSSSRSSSSSSVSSSSSSSSSLSSSSSSSRSSSSISSSSRSSSSISSSSRSSSSISSSISSSSSVTV